MTELLVSVRSAREALLALQAGVHLIDVKEPRRGSLGAAPPRVWRDVAAQVQQQVPLSVALGELVELDASLCTSVPSEYAYAKVGLAGCAQNDWQPRLAEAWSRLPHGVQPVAVIYADWQRALAPPPADVLSLVADADCRAVLIDTAIKDGTTLLTHCRCSELAALLNAARSQMVDVVVLAGSLSPVDFAELLPLEPDYIAVRTAACAGGRNGPLDPDRLQALLALLRQPARR